MFVWPLQTLLLKQSLLIESADYLQDQLNIRNVEANIMGEHIHGLELKLTELEKFPERVRVMDNDLMRSDSQCWLLMEEVQCKEEELQKAASQIEKLESATLDMQCEIESLKLDLTTIEQRLFDAESFSQHTAEYKVRIEKQLKEHELQLQEARKTIDHLEVENKQLKKEYLPGRAPKQSSSTGVEQLDKTVEHDGHANYERGHEILEKMGKQNEEPELIIEQLKVRVCVLLVLQHFGISSFEYVPSVVFYYQTSSETNYFERIAMEFSCLHC